MPTINSFKSVDNVTSNIITGTLYNGIANFTFAAGETIKYMLLEIPTDVACQYVVQGLTILPYDKTFKISLIEGVTSMNTGSPIIAINLNRNFSDIPVCTYSINPTGVYGGEGSIISDFKPYIRQNDFPQASNILKENVERLLKFSKKYLFKFERDTDTNSLSLQFRWIWFAN
jgi:hypothetical protein